MHGKGLLHGQTERCIMESLLKTFNKEMEKWHGKMEDDTKVSERTIKCMEKDCLHGQTGRCIMESFLKIFNKEREKWNGQMEKYIMGLWMMGRTRGGKPYN